MDDIYLLLQIVGGAPLPKPMHLLYAVPCPWCSKTIWSTRLIWLIFWIHDGWESEWEKWLTPKIFVLQEYLEILWVYVGLLLELAFFHPFHPFFNGSFDDWIVNFVWGAFEEHLVHLCWFLDAAQQHLFTEVNSTRPAGSFQGTVVLCWTCTCASDAQQKTTSLHAVNPKQLQGPMWHWNISTLYLESRSGHKNTKRATKTNTIRGIKAGKRHGVDGIVIILSSLQNSNHSLKCSWTLQARIV